MDRDDPAGVERRFQSEALAWGAVLVVMGFAAVVGVIAWACCISAGLSYSHISTCMHVPDCAYHQRVDCCDPTVYDDTFDARRADERLHDYRRSGLTGWTRRLVAGLISDGVDGMTVLDIGAGVGAVHHALLEAGAASAVDVDASGPYLDAARGEAERRGLADRVTYHKGDVVALAPELGSSDLVALDRVVCCYPHMEALVRVAAERTRRRLGMVLPRDDAWIRAGVDISNRWSALRGDPFRVHVHRTAAVLGVARAAGLAPVAIHRGRFWQTLILERPS